MKLTNHYNLPEGLVQVVQNQLHPPTPNRYSVTHLIGPPLIRTLQIERWDDIETDVSDYLWLLLGVGVDTVLSNTNTKDNVTQHKMEESIDGNIVVGIADIINNTIIDDYKCTSVYSYLLGDKPEWTAQLNLYSYLLTLGRRRNNINIPVTNLHIQAILRDWQKNKVYEKDYPPVAFQTVEVDLWTFEQQDAYIKSRLKDHIENPHRECTDEEKWKSEDTYAVMQSGRKSAWRVLDSLEQAEQWMKENIRGDKIVKRPGKCKRCLDYCPVRSCCQYAKNIT